MLEKHFDTASEFAAHLRRSHERWGTGHSNWVFRGQRADFPLLPKLWRPSEQQKNVFYQNSMGGMVAAMGSAIAGRTDEFRSRYCELYRLLYAEQEAVKAFRALADDLGFHVPTTPLGDPWYPSDAEQAGPACVVADSHLPTQATALAQHHGMATRLLDWTEDAATAAYFAATEWLDYRKKDASDRIVLWAFETRTLRKPGKEYQSLVFVRPDRAPNPFMRAQRGLFTWHRNAELSFMEHGVWPTHLEPFARLEGTLPGRPRDIIQKLSLAGSAVKDLVNILLLEQVTRVHLMPTLDNVARTVKTPEHYACRNLVFERSDIGDEGGADAPRPI
jgi:hypothetical protein